MVQKEVNEGGPLSAKSRPQYHYFYGSTGTSTEDALNGNDQEQDSLIGEELVPTDHEGDSPNSSEHDLQHVLITNGDSTKPWFFTPRSDEQQGNSYGLGRIFAIMILAIALSGMVIVFLPHTSEPLPMAETSYVPFQAVNRADFGDPVEGFIDTSLFHPTLLSTTGPRSFVFPFPTGAFWTNLVVPSPDSQASYPIVVYPYAYKWANSFLEMSYPGGHRYTNEHNIIDTFVPELKIRTKEVIANRYVTKYDPLSVTLRFVATPTSKFEIALVQGSPYTTIKYLNSTPVFEPLSIFKSVQCPGDDDENFSDLVDEGNEGERRRLFGVCSIDDNSKDEIYLRGVQFIFKTPEGVSWIVFASEPVNLVYDAIRKTTISSIAPFTGVIRLAYIPAREAADKSVESSTGLRRLIYHAGVYPVGGQVSWEFHYPTSGSAKPTAEKETLAGKYATIHISYATHSMTDNNLRPNSPANALLMLSLPHHAQLIPKSAQLNGKKFDISYRCIKGPLTPILGSTWSYDEPLPDFDFDGPLQDIDHHVAQVILDQVEDDITRVLPTVTEDIYGFGKQVARLAQLAHISSRLREPFTGNATSPDRATDLMNKAGGVLTGFLERFLSDQVVDGLVFDSNLGGLVSKNGLMDKGADFGNGRYNDHHFHYGYILYACSIMTTIDPSFLKRFGSHVDTIFHDVAHGSNGDSRAAPSNGIFFPLSRHKSWFDGHSFATGMFPFGTGKSQESSSEAVNCYYGAYLWSLVRHGTIGSDATDFARLLLATEIRGAKTYWHMLPPAYSSNSSIVSGIYNPKFQKQYMVGNVGMLDVAVNTWFGNDPLYVHMINVIPVTAATGFLFDESYVRHEYPYLMGSRSDVQMAWRGYTTSIHAIIDANAAWDEAQTLVSYELDSALSKSQVLYWITQRPGFNVTVGTSGKDKTPSKNGFSTKGDPGNSPDGGSSCESNAGCTKLGLVGQCCPTLDGVFLGCC